MTQVFLQSGSSSPWTVPSGFSYNAGTYAADLTAQGPNLYFFWGDAGTRPMIGQTFVASQTVAADHLGVLMTTNGAGSPTDDLYATIYSGTFGTVLGQARAAGGSNVSLFYLGHMFYFEFNTPITLTSGQTYSFSLHRAGPIDGSNYYRVLGDSVNFYANGAQYYHDGVNWGVGPAGQDITFTIGKREHSVIMLGCGGSGDAGTTGVSGNGGGGGGGGSLMKAIYSGGTYGSTVPFLVAGGGSGNDTQWQSSTAGTGNYVYAGGGKNASTTTGGAGGTGILTSGSPSVTFTQLAQLSGGAGGSSGATRGGGGGGAPGNWRTGGGTGASVTTSGWGGGGGGGGNGSSGNATNPSSATFGSGGAGWSGAAGTTNGGAGTGNCGSAGSSTVASGYVNGGTAGGSYDGSIYWTFGTSGGGGGGGGWTTNSAQAIAGGPCTYLGGGGGGSGYTRGTGTHTAGVGGNGLIVVNYLTPGLTGSNYPTVPMCPAAASGTAIDAGTNPKSITRTVAQGDVIVVAGYCQYGADGGGNVTLSIASSGVGTVAGWTLLRDTAVANANNPYMRVWTATAAAGGSIQIDVTRSGSTSGSFNVNAQSWQMSDGVGASARNDNGTGSGAPTVSITTTVQHAGIQYFDNDFSHVTGAWTFVNTGMSTGGQIAQDDGQQGTNNASYAAHAVDFESAGAKSFGMSAPSTQRYINAAVEIKGYAGPAAPKAFPPFSRPRKLSYNRRIS